jgi:hypothetical protein
VPHVAGLDPRLRSPTFTPDTTGLHLLDCALSNLVVSAVGGTQAHCRYENAICNKMRMFVVFVFQQFVVCAVAMVSDMERQAPLASSRQRGASSIHSRNRCTIPEYSSQSLLVARPPVLTCTLLDTYEYVNVEQILQAGSEALYCVNMQWYSVLLDAVKARDNIVCMHSVVRRSCILTLFSSDRYSIHAK